MLTRANLHGYQIEAVNVLTTQKKAYLAIFMGGGKTVSALTAVADLIDQGERIRAIVIAPKRVAESVWATEAAKWPHLAGLQVSLIAGDVGDRALACSESSKPIHIVSRDNIAWLVEHHGKAWPYNLLIIDEADSFKNAGSQRFKMLRRVRGLCDRAWLMSGTPAPNGLLDLWPQYFLLDGGERLGKTMTSYKQAFFTSDHMGWKFTLNPGAEAEIHRRIADITVSMRAEDHLAMPDRVDRVHRVALTAAAEAAYEALERDYILTHASSEITAANAAVLAGKLLQLSNGSVYDEQRNVVHIHEAKLDALEGLILGAPGPVLVMYLFKHDLARILSRFPGSRQLVDGKDIDDWNAGKVDVLLAHPASCGHGLNLQGADKSSMVWFGLPWSLGLYQQACARIHRQGVKHAVTIWHLVIAGSIDEDVMRVLASKSAGQERLLSAMRDRIKGMTHG